MTVTIQRAGGFSGSVTITVDGLPSGVTTGGLTIASGMSSGQLTLDAAFAALVGNAALTVRANGTGVAERTANLQLTVNSATEAGFTIGLSPTQGSVEAGSSVQSTVNITRTGGFTGAVTLSASNLPAGVTASFNPAAPTGNTSTMTLSAAGGASASGPTQVTVQGTATGILNQMAQFGLTVTVPGGGGGGNVTIDFCAGTGIPIWVGYQSGTGAWTQATGAGPSYSFAINANIGGVAWVLNDGVGGFQNFFFFGTQQEIATFGMNRCGGTIGAGRTITGTVVGMPPPPAMGGVLAQVSLDGQFTNTPIFANGTQVTFNGVRAGIVDLIGGVSLAQAAVVTPAKGLLIRNVNGAVVQDLGDIIDFSGPNSFVPEMRQLTLNNLGGAAPAVATLFRTPNGSGTVGASFDPTAWYGVPAALLQPGDIHMVIATAVSFIGNPADGLTNTRTINRFVFNPADLTLTFGDELTAPQVQGLAGNGHQRARAEFAIQSAYAKWWFASFMQLDNPGQTRQTQIQMTEGYRGSGTGTVTLEIAELAGAANWNANYGLRVGVETRYVTSGTGWTAPGGILEPGLFDGNSFLSATRMGKFTP